MLKTTAIILTTLCASAAADVYHFPAAEGRLETSGEGCSGPVMKEITRAVADAVDENGLTVDITDKTFEVVQKLPDDGERRTLAPKRAFTSGGTMGIWSSAPKNPKNPGNILCTVTIGDVLPCDPYSKPHGCRSGEFSLGRLGATMGSAIGASVELKLGKCVATWTNARGAR